MSINSSNDSLVYLNIKNDPQYFVFPATYREHLDVQQDLKPNARNPSIRSNHCVTLSSNEDALPEPSQKGQRKRVCFARLVLLALGAIDSVQVEEEFACRKVGKGSVQLWFQM
jgi:hypothetical protein